MGASRALLLLLAAVASITLYSPQGAQAGPVNLTALITAPLKLPDSVFDPPSWAPVTLLNYATYLPGLKDWASVISACKAAGKKERRNYNMFIRVAFHDAMAVDLSACVAGDKANCHGADSSILLSDEEMTRPENGHDDLSKRVAKVVLKIASFYGVSVADTLAVCSTVAVEELSRGRIKFFGGESGHEKTFRVGRLDWVKGEDQDTPPNTLPPKDISNEAFDAFWKTHNLTLEEGVALMGSHAILELQGCRTGPEPDAFCDPRMKDDCKDLRMYKWDNHYYKDVCTPTIKITPDEEPPAEKEEKDMTEAKFEAAQKTAICRFTSKENRILQLEELQEKREGTFQPDPNEPHEPEGRPYLIEWTNEGCEAAAEWGNDAAYCPHTIVPQSDTEPNSEPWMYTVNDAFLGHACGDPDASGVNKSIQEHMRKFALDQDEWDAIFKTAWTKVLIKYAKWPLINDITDKPTLISGKECKIYKLDAKCKEGGGGGLLPGVSLPIIDDIAACAGCGTLKVGSRCDECCVCNTGFSVDGIARAGRALLGNFTMPDLPKPTELPAVAGITDLPDLPSLDVERVRRRRGRV